MKAVPTLIVVLVAVAAAAVLSLLGCGASEQAATQYQCPMHPTYVSDRPGDCPICGMRLVPVETRTAPTTVPAYTCPMHPEVTSDKPGKCPKCGMDLVPTGEATPAPTEASAEHAQAAGGRRVLFYRSPMDPSVTSPVPAQDSMGMDYVPVYSDEQPETAAADIAGHAAVTSTPRA
jgi:hypothetical protein